MSVGMARDRADEPRDITQRWLDAAFSVTTTFRM